MTSQLHYRGEIAQMMFVFGDTTEPDEATVALVEDLTRAQIGEIIIQAIAQAHKRSSKTVTAEDVIFLIRHDAKKTNRLKQFLSWKDVRKPPKGAGGAAGGAADLMDSATVGDEANEDLLENEPTKLKPRKNTIKFSWELVTTFSHILDATNSSSLTTEGDLLDTNMTDPADSEDVLSPPSMDEDARLAYEEQIARLRVADEITRDMSKEEYVYYSECRQASFTFKKAKKFRDWSGLMLYYKNKPNSDVLDILGFLAYECVARLTETALQVKQQWDTRDKASGRGETNAEGQVGLFGQNAVERRPLATRHVQEAFRRLQETTFAMSNFKGGMVRSPLTIF
ncbi:Transcription initiation protein spt3 [Podochytrium sp. JEL0797]|nr:Transcription initiation protein spt3 [Podochytrium sp. JEL0797]